MVREHARKLWLRVHRYLGLSAGAVLAITGLSGSLIVFAWPLDAWLNRDVMTVAVPAEKHGWRPLDEIIEKVRAELPSEARLNGLTFPRATDTVFRVSYTRPPERDGYEAFVDPYTAKLLGTRLWGDFDRCCSAHGPLMAMIYRFHDSFWMGNLGLCAVGTTGLLAMVSLISGLVLWWPSPGRWRKAFRWKRAAGAARRIFDLHNLAGIYSLPVLAVLCFTGAYLSFPEQARRVTGWFSPLSEVTDTHPESAAPERPLLSLDRIVAAADRALPGGELDFVVFPEGSSAEFEVYKHSPAEVVPTVTRRKALIDGHTGALVALHDRTRRSAGDVFEEWQLGLHSGQALGLPGQILVLAGGLMPGVLFVTGLIRWLQKRSTRGRSRSREAAMSTAFTGDDSPKPQ